MTWTSSGGHWEFVHNTMSCLTCEACLSDVCYVVSQNTGNKLSLHIVAALLKSFLLLKMDDLENTRLSGRSGFHQKIPRCCLRSRN